MSIQTTKRIALGVIASLVFAPFAALAPASAANADATAVSITPVRVSFVGATQDTVAKAELKFTTPNEIDISAIDAFTLTVANAPTAAAEVTIWGAADATKGTKDSLGASPSAVNGFVATTDVLAADAAAGDIITLGLSANVSGSYSGTLLISDDDANDDVTVNWSFTTRGAPASYTVTADSTTLNRSAVATFTVTVLDAAGNRTQVSTVDSMNITATTGTLSAASLTAANLFDGIHTFTLTAANADGSSTVTVTPAGVLPTQGLAAIATVLTVNGAIFGTVAADISVTVPATAVAGGTPTSAETAAVPTGTSAVTVSFTGGTGSENLVHRFKMVLSAGTLNGSTTLTQYVNVTANSSKLGSFNATIGGAGLVTGRTLTITQVTAANADIAGLGLVITQTDASVTAATITQSPGTAQTAKLGDTVNVTVTVADQFGNSQAGWTVRAFRGATTGTLLDTKTTSAAGTAVVALTNASTLVAGSSETYSFSAQPAVGSAIDDTNVLTITYTATGIISEISVASGTANTTTPLLASQSTVVAVMPFVLVPTDGTANAAATGTFTVTPAAGASAGTAAGEAALFTPTTTTATNVTVTASAGAFVSETASTAWDKGSSSILVPSGTAVYAFATKVGTHTLTFTAAGRTVTAQFRAANAATDFYNIAITGPTSVVAGSNNVATVTVTDVFGNPVNAAAGDVVVTTSAPTTILMGGYNSSSSVDVGADGTARVLFIATEALGSATLTAAAGVATNAWGSTYVAPTGAPAPVASRAITVAVTAKPVEVVYDKPTLSIAQKAGRIILSGTAENEEGDIIVYIKRIGKTTWVERAKTFEVAAPGDFNGSIKAPKGDVVIRVKQEGTGLFSNQVIVLKP